MTTIAPASVFDDHTPDVYAIYDVQIVLRDKLMGGIPYDPKLIEGWLMKNMGIDDQAELLQRMRQTLLELGVDIPEEATFDEVVAAAGEIAATKQTCGFKRNGAGLYLEQRNVKAMLKESVNTLFADQRWGKTKKGPKSFTAERAFIEPREIPLGRDEPDGVELVVGHVSDAKGKRSTLGYYEYVLRPTLDFKVYVVDDSIDATDWVRIWLHAEKNGLGTLRSQGHGQFVVTHWERSD